MSDNEIEDVSFLPGESLHRKAVYEPNILQRCFRFIRCPSRGKAPLIAVVVGIFLLIVILIPIFACQNCKQTGTVSTTRAPPDTMPPPSYISTNGEPFLWQDVRLPRTVVPVHYKLFIHPNISQSLFSGSVVIQCQINESTDFIVFHIKQLNITELTVSDSKTGYQLQQAGEYLEYKENEQIYVKMGTSLSKGDTITMTIKFKGQLVNSTMTGFYKSMYKTLKGKERYIATTHFEPTDARAAFPCFDEPELKAKFELSMVRDRDHISLFNMPLKNTENYLDDLQVDHFEESMKMSTYLVAFVVCDYKNLTNHTAQNTLVRVFVPPDQIELGQYALQAAVKILDYYNQYFGIKYPLPKQDLIAIPDFAAGAMENWGLITYRMTAILYDPDISSASSKEWVAVVVAHELAHQWFGNLVTMNWWEDLWLNEGFASFVENIGATVVNPSFQMNEQFVLTDLQRALQRDSFASSHAIQLPIQNPNQINEIFDSITYSKGASIIRMLENYMGKEKFKEGLQAYLKKYQYSNAVTEDLWNSLSGVLDSGSADIAELMDTWTKQMGYPVVTLTSNGKNQVTVTQERFLIYPNSSVKDDSPYGYQWQVPFSYCTANNRDVQKLVLKEKSALITLSDNPGWILGNPGMNGFYRVNYDSTNWKAIISQLNHDNTKFTAGERAGLISDAFQLSRAERMSVNQSLDLTMYLVQDEDYLPWRAFLSQIGYLEARIKNTPTLKYYKKYLLKLMNKLLEKFKWGIETDHLQIFLQGSILSKAVSLGHVESINKGRQLFQNWRQNHSEINVNLKHAIFRAGIQYGDNEDWEACFLAYLNETVPSEKSTLLTALTYTRDVRLLARLLTYSLDDKIVRPQDTSSLIDGISANPAGELLAWRFFMRNWSIFRKRYAEGSFTMSRLIKYVAGGFDTQFDLDDVTAFFSTRDAGSGQGAVSEVKEIIQMNMNWRDKHEQSVSNWFIDHGQNM